MEFHPLCTEGEEPVSDGESGLQETFLEAYKTNKGKFWVKRGHIFIALMVGLRSLKSTVKNHKPKNHMVTLIT